MYLYPYLYVSLQIPVRFVELGVVCLAAPFRPCDTCVCPFGCRVVAVIAPFPLSHSPLPPPYFPSTAPSAVSVDCSFGLKLATRLGLILEWSQ